MLRNQIQIQSLKWVKLNVNYALNFKATNRFMQRKSLRLHAKSKIAQKLSKEMEEKNYKFSKMCNSVAKKDNCILHTLGNMDETPVNFDIPSNRNMNVKGKKTILVKTIGNEKEIHYCFGMHGWQ